jgi:hypothetical protein
MVLRQTAGRVRAAGRAPAPARAHLHEPVEIVTAVRAAVRPPAVQRAEHPPLLTSKQSHLSLPPPRSSPPESLPATGYAAHSLVGRFGQQIPPACAVRYRLIVHPLQNTGALLHSAASPVQLPAAFASCLTLDPYPGPSLTYCPPARFVPTIRERAGALFLRQHINHVLRSLSNRVGNARRSHGYAESAKASPSFAPDPPRPIP